MPTKRTTLLRAKNNCANNDPSNTTTPSSVTTSVNNTAVLEGVDVEMDSSVSVTPQSVADPSPPPYSQYVGGGVDRSSSSNGNGVSSNGCVTGLSDQFGIHVPGGRSVVSSSAPKPTKTLLRRTPVPSSAPSPQLFSTSPVSTSSSTLPVVDAIPTSILRPPLPPPAPPHSCGISDTISGAKRPREEVAGDVVDYAEDHHHHPPREVSGGMGAVIPFIVKSLRSVDPSPHHHISREGESAESPPTSLQQKKGGSSCSPKQLSNTLRLLRPNSKSADGGGGGSSRGMTQRSIAFPSQTSGPLHALLGDDEDELIPSSSLVLSTTPCLTPTPTASPTKKGILLSGGCDTIINKARNIPDDAQSYQKVSEVPPTITTATCGGGGDASESEAEAPPVVTPDDDPCGDVTSSSTMGPDYNDIVSISSTKRVVTVKPVITTTLLRRKIPEESLGTSPSKTTTTSTHDVVAAVSSSSSAITSSNQNTKAAVVALLTSPTTSHPPPPPPASRVGFYGLPPVAESIFRRRGVKDLYKWQDHVLTRADVMKGNNFVYSLPTSGGKTLVAEVILLRTLVEQRKSVMFVLPFVALAEEKVNSLREFEDALGIRVEGYYGTVGRHPPPMAPTAFICTMEKANSLYNALHEEGRAQYEIGCVVVDELHMVGDGRRGAILELLLTKIRVVSKGATQIVGMSATVPNLDQIAAWLGAACYVGTFRPVPLLEHVVCGGAIIPKDELHLPARQPGNCVPQDDHEAVVRIITEHPDSSSIVFCATRGQCAEYSQRLVRTMERLNIPRRRPGVDALLKELAGCGQESYRLMKLVPFGVAYHNGSLSMEEREIIEKGYRNKIITILCATSTLAAGVNLPARRVVFKTPYVGMDFLKKSTYLQMCGRAGRAGLDAHGESYLVLSKRDFNRGVQLVHGVMEPIRSAVFSEKHSFARMLLESIGVGMLHRSNSHVYNDLFPTTDSFTTSSSSSSLPPSSSAARAEEEDDTTTATTPLRGSTTTIVNSSNNNNNTSIVQLWARCLLCHSTKQSLPVARVYDALSILEKSDLFGVSLTPSRVEMTPRGGFRGKKKRVMMDGQDDSPTTALGGSSSSSSGGGGGIRMPTVSTSGAIGSSSTLGPSPLFTMEESTLPPPTATPDSMSGGLVAAAGDADSCSLPPPPITSSSRAEVDDDGEEGGATTGPKHNITTGINNNNGDDDDDEEPIMLSLPEVEEYFQLDPVNLLVKSAIVTLVDTGMVTAVSTSTSTISGDVDGGPSSSTNNQQQRQHASPTVRISMGGDGGGESSTDLSFELTPFGASAVRSFFEVDEAVLVRDELISLQERGIILSNDLHICYFLTPVKSLEGGHCDWTRYLNVLACMPDIRQTIASSIGVNFGLVHQYAMGLNIPQQQPTKQQQQQQHHTSGARGSAGNGGGGGGGGGLTADQLVDPKVRQDFSLQRFYIALSLCDVLNEVPASVVEERYGHNYGQQQAMLRAASVFSSSIVNFCAAMGWHNLEALFAAYVKRLGFGVKADLLPLMEIPGVKAGKARVLWTAGLKKPTDIAKLSPDDVFQRVKDRCAPDNKTAKFFTRQSAVATVREATKLLQRQLKDKKGELQDMEMQARMHHGGGGLLSPTSNNPTSFGGGSMGMGGSSFGSMGPPPTPGGGIPSPSGFAPTMGGFTSSSSSSTFGGYGVNGGRAPPPIHSHHPHTTLLPR